MGIVQRITTGKCPKCGQGDIYKSKGSVFPFLFPKMHKNCNHCGHVYEREPGFFYGAMYVSYALTVAEGVAVYIISAIVLQKTFDFKMFLAIAITIIGLSFFNMRLSRIIWIYLFKPKKQ